MPISLVYISCISTYTFNVFKRFALKLPKGAGKNNSKELKDKKSESDSGWRRGFGEFLFFLLRKKREKTVKRFEFLSVIFKSFFLSLPFSQVFQRASKCYTYVILYIMFIRKLLLLYFSTSIQRLWFKTRKGTRLDTIKHNGLSGTKRSKMVQVEQSGAKWNKLETNVKLDWRVQSQSPKVNSLY